MGNWAEDPELLATFRAEVEDRLASLSAGLLQLENHPSPKQLVAGLFRDAHTVKGSARMMGLRAVLDTAHAAEDLLGAIRDGRFPGPARPGRPAARDGRRHQPFDPRRRARRSPGEHLSRADRGVARRDRRRRPGRPCRGWPSRCRWLRRPSSSRPPPPTPNKQESETPAATAVIVPPPPPAATSTPRCAVARSDVVDAGRRQTRCCRSASIGASAPLTACA